MKMGLLDSKASSSSRYVYVTDGCSRMEFYDSTPASPRRKMGCHQILKQFTSDDASSRFDNYEFETSKKWKDYGNSLPTVENFSDENCLSGLMMPLKLPPRLQRDGDNGISSSKSQRPLRKLPSARMNVFPSARMNSWADGFDPFMAAWQKVRNENREENIHIRPSRSHSPFRILSKYSNNQSLSQEFDRGNSPMKQIMQVSTPNYGELKGELKGLAYARWVREQTRAGLSPRKIKNQSFFLLGRRAVRPEKFEQNEQEPSSIKGEFVKENGNMKSMVEKLKELFLKSASFDRENPGDNIARMSIYKKLKLKVKGNSSGTTLVGCCSHKNVRFFCFICSKYQ